MTGADSAVTDVVSENKKRGKSVWDEIQRLRQEMTALSIAMEDKAEFSEMKKEAERVFDKVDEVHSELNKNNARILLAGADLLNNFVIPMYVGTWRLIESANVDKYYGDSWNEETEKLTKKDVAIAKVGRNIILGTATDGVCDDVSQEIQLNKEVDGETWFFSGTRFKTTCRDPETKKIVEEVDRYIENGLMTVINSIDGVTCSRVYKKLP